MSHALQVVEDRMDKLPPAEQTRVRALVDVLLTFDDFPTFAAMMVEHNLAMQRGEPSQLSKEAEASQAQCVAPRLWLLLGCCACLMLCVWTSLAGLRTCLRKTITGAIPRVLCVGWRHLTCVRTLVCGLWLSLDSWCSSR